MLDILWRLNERQATRRQVTQEGKCTRHEQMENHNLVLALLFLLSFSIIGVRSVMQAGTHLTPSPKNWDAPPPLPLRRPLSVLFPNQPSYKPPDLIEDHRTTVPSYC